MLHDLQCYISFLLLIIIMIINLVASQAERNSDDKMEKFHEFLLTQPILHTKPATLWLFNEETHNNFKLQLSTPTLLQDL